MAEQQEGRREADVVETMVRLADTIVRSYDSIELLRDLAESCARVTASDAAGVSLRDGDRLHFVVATSEESELVELDQVGTQQGPCVDAFRSGEHVAVPTISVAGDRWPDWAASANELGFLAADAFPLRLRHETIGSIDLYARRSRTLTPRDVSVVAAFADMATIGLLHERAISDAQLVRDQLQHALDSRVMIEQAKGVIAERHDIRPDQAFDLIRSHARSHNERLLDTARRVVAGEVELPPA